MVLNLDVAVPRAFEGVRPAGVALRDLFPSTKFAACCAKSRRMDQLGPRRIAAGAALRMPVHNLVSSGEWRIRSHRMTKLKPKRRGIEALSDCPDLLRVADARQSTTRAAHAWPAIVVVTTPHS